VGEQSVKEIHRYPVVGMVADPSVPPEVMRAAIEAEKCLAVSAYSACGVMARRAIDALSQDKQAKGKDLNERLQNLKGVHAITPDLWEWAEELRVAGRSGAHPEWEDLSSAEAEYTVRFMREIIRYVYINPAERSARRLKEQAQKKPKEPK
jgi:hypothetical protein